MILPIIGEKSPTRFITYTCTCSCVTSQSSTGQIDARAKVNECDQKVKHNFTAVNGQTEKSGRFFFYHGHRCKYPLPPLELSISQ